MKLVNDEEDFDADTSCEEQGEENGEEDCCQV